MSTPSLTYDFYRNTYKGSLGEGGGRDPAGRAAGGTRRGGGR